MKTANMGRKMLPAEFEKRYSSEALKKLIAEDGMWFMIPSVSGTLNSAYGIRRLKENQLLFDFIEQYFSNDAYAFEPNMEDGRYTLLPDNVSHQGIGVMVSREFPGCLEVCQFWYPCEYTEKEIAIGPTQVCIPVFSANPDAELAALIRKLYIDEENRKSYYCTFAFNMKHIVTLRDYFLDDMDATEKTILSALKDADEITRINGVGLANFMRRIVEQ